MSIIVNFTPTGMIPDKAQNPFLPTAPNEIIDDVLAAWECGITMVHLHVRDPKTGEPSSDIRLYAQVIEGIRRSAPGLVIAVSLSGRRTQDFQQRSAVLDLDGGLKPDMGSLTLSSLNFNKEASINTPQDIIRLAEKMKERGIHPELEAFDSGMINFAKYILSKGIISAPCFFNLIFGNIACAQANLIQAGLMLNELPPGSLWTMGGIGNFQLQINSLGIAWDGGVRVGLEDNLWFDRKRTRLASNLDLLHRVHDLIQANERSMMTAEEFRSRLALAPFASSSECSADRTTKNANAPAAEVRQSVQIDNEASVPFPSASTPTE